MSWYLCGGSGARCYVRARRGRYAAPWALQFPDARRHVRASSGRAALEHGSHFEDRQIHRNHDGADNDARVVTAGLSLIDAAETQWHLLLRYGKLNRGGPPDDTNTLTPTPQDTASIDVTHSRLLSFGQIEIGIGIEAIDDAATGTSSEDFRGYLQWSSAH